MNRIVLIIITGILLHLSGFPQNRTLTIAEASGMNPALRATDLQQLQWIGKSTFFSYVKGDALVKGSLKSTSVDTLVTLENLNASLRIMNVALLKRIPPIIFHTESMLLFNSGNTYLIFDLFSGNARKVSTCDSNASNIDIENSNLKIAYTKGNNLYISFRDKETPVTSEPNPGIVYGSNQVHRNEFGIDKGTFWSPGGNLLAFYRMDETMVTDYPLVDISKRIATVTPVKYPMAGMASHKVTIGIYNTNTGKTIYLHTRYFDESDTSNSIALNDEMEYLTNVTWSPDEKYIYVACLNREQNHLKLNKYDAATGYLINTLFEEKNDKYVEPLHGPVFFNNDPSKFIWQSQRDGYNHLYLYDSDGKLIRQLTKGSWVVTRLLKSGQDGEKVFFLGNKENPLEDQLFSLSIKKDELIEVTKKPGMHTPQVSYDGQYILDKFENISTANQIEILDARGKTIRVLLENSNPLKDFNLGKMSVFTLKNEENTDLYCRLIKPAEFDSTKKYPVIIYVYGGPHSQLITNSWLGGAGLFLNYLAEQGFIVFTLDNRGTANRGLVFEQSIYRQLGVKEVADQMIGVNYLKSLPYVDSTRIGINGWSYGGFMTISMMLKYPFVFKAAVCGGPVTDWKYYEVMYGERYMDTPDSNPEGYENSSLLNSVKNLRGKLLIVHDYQDNTVVPQNSLTFLKKCVDEGKQVDFFIYPGHPHNVRGKDRVHLNQKMVQYFKDYL